MRGGVGFRVAGWMVLFAALGGQPAGTMAGTPKVAAPSAATGMNTASRSDAALHLDAVRIEGKLYSPQALFIVSRQRPSFGRDAVVPHYLRQERSPCPLPYRLHQDVRAAVAAPAARTDPGH